MPRVYKELRLTGSNLWYVVGLITTDGCLSNDHRHIDITSKDYQLLKAVKSAASLTNKITDKYNGRGQKSYRIGLANRKFYDFLLSVGLMTNKSLILGPIDVPREYFADFLRGVIDGDGCIRTWIHPTNHGKQWSLRVYSGSRRFLLWLRDMVTQQFSVTGSMHVNDTKANPCWILKYGKMAAREICRRCYYPRCIGLNRKIVLAGKCVNARFGWGRSKTVLNH
ncbi:MAG TPA: LAGLIDADG family homing endonuclease [Candidatus Omnitrophota bacterium]|nr:LAGLIDADG family homing endonuclease [Candidatus Omnitrophota bacterium]